MLANRQSNDCSAVTAYTMTHACTHACMDGCAVEQREREAGLRIHNRQLRKGGFRANYHQIK